MSVPMSRDQRVVKDLYVVQADAIERLAAHRESAARARALPSMVLRHGIMLTLEYLDAKVKSADGDTAGGEAASQHDLAALLRAGLRAALPMLTLPQGSNQWPKTSDLANMPAMHYIAVQDAAVAVATWIKRLVEARIPDEGNRK